MRTLHMRSHDLSVSIYYMQTPLTHKHTRVSTVAALFQLCLCSGTRSDAPTMPWRLSARGLRTKDQGVRNARMTAADTVGWISADVAHRHRPMGERRPLEMKKSRASDGKVDERVY